MLPRPSFHGRGTEHSPGVSGRWYVVAWGRCGGASDLTDDADGDDGSHLATHYAAA